MRLTFDASVLEQPFTGVAKTTLCLYESVLKNHGYIISSITGVYRKELFGPVCESILFQKIIRKSRFSIRRETDVLAAYKKTRPDIIHFPWNGSIPKNLPRSIVAMTLHDVLPIEIPGHFSSDREENEYRTSKQNDLDLSDVVFTISEYSKKQIENNFRTNCELIVIPHGITLQRQVDEAFAQKACSKPFLLYLGGYDKRKGLPELIKVHTDLYKSGIVNIPLYLVGQPHYFSNDFKKIMVVAKGIGAVKELGYMSDIHVSTLLTYAQALVYPSKFEGFGLPPLEAMAHGCPVITTRCCSIPEVCGDSAIYINPDDPNQIAESLVTVCQNKLLLEVMTDKGLKQAEKFDWVKSSKKFTDAINFVEKDRKVNDEL